MITIPFSYRGNEYSVKWTNEQMLKYYAFIQNGRFGTTVTPNGMTIDEFLNIYADRLTKRLEFFDVAFKQLPDNAKVINVGCGVGTLELVLAQAHNWVFYMVDKTSSSMIGKGSIKYHADNAIDHGFYNSWDVLIDGIQTTELNPQQFVMLDTDDEWPSEVDLVMSSFSWCWHYPLDVYWDKTKKSLKLGGKIMLDVLNTENSDDSIKIINTFANTLPLERKYPVKETSRCKNQFLIRDNSHGSNYLW
jgi:SAM-dependent methyltransferase